MIQKIYNASETPFMCDVCSEAIINPLCPSCLTVEINAWLTLYPDLRHELLPRLHGYLATLRVKIDQSVHCIKCKSYAYVCPYCFTEKVLEELKSMNANKIVLKEFFEFFNFDFDHTGYYEEGESLGAY